MHTYQTTKGTVTEMTWEEYQEKKKLMKAIHGIEIKEI